MDKLNTNANLDDMFDKINELVDAANDHQHGYGYAYTDEPAISVPLWAKRSKKGQPPAGE